MLKYIFGVAVVITVVVAVGLFGCMIAILNARYQQKKDDETGGLL